MNQLCVNHFTVLSVFNYNIGNKASILFLAPSNIWLTRRKLDRQKSQRVKPTRRWCAVKLSNWHPEIFTEPDLAPMNVQTFLRIIFLFLFLLQICLAVGVNLQSKIQTFHIRMSCMFLCHLFILHPACKGPSAAHRIPYRSPRHDKWLFGVASTGQDLDLLACALLYSLCSDSWQGRGKKLTWQKPARHRKSSQ